MKNRRIVPMLIGATAMLSGCSLNPSVEEPKLLVDLSAEPIKFEVPKATVESVSIAEPKELFLGQALALTLHRNPDLQSFSHTVRVGEARMLQAGLMPNPELSFALEDAFGPYGDKSYSQATLQLSQLVELGGKRSARVRAAAALRDQFSNEYEIKRVETLTSLTDKFIRTVTDEHLLKLAEKGEALARQSLTNIQKRSQAGGVSELEEAKARVLLARSHIAVEHAEHELLSSKKELAAFWGEEDPQFAKISIDLFQKTVLPTFDALSSRIEHSPEIKKWVTEKRLREAEKKLADAKAVPNLLIGAGPRRLEITNDTSWVFQVSMPLNLFDRNQGSRKEAEVLQDKVSIEGDASHLRLKTTLFSLYQEAKHAQTELETMKKEIIPQAERSLKTAQDGYTQGRFSYLDLADAQRTLIEVHRENIEAAYSFHSFINAIERLLGAPL